MNFNDVTIASIKRNAYRIHFWFTSKDDAINMINNSSLNEKVILNRANKYYENNKEVLREKARNKYKELFEEEENKKRQYRKKQIL